MRRKWLLLADAPSDVRAAARLDRVALAPGRRVRGMGYTVLRFTYHDVMYEWPRVEREIRAAIALGLAG